MKIATLLAFLVPALASPHVKRQGPLGNQVSILSSQTSGNGCPQGTVATTVSPDRTVITFGFDSFQTYIGPGERPQDSSKNCQIHLSLKYPGGYQLALLRSTYHGFAQLDRGVTGNFYSTYFFSQNAAATANSRSTLSGPQFVNGQVYEKVDDIENASVVWSPCGANGILNVNNRIALTSTNSSASGQMTDDDATVAFYQQVLIQWRPCR